MNPSANRRGFTLLMVVGALILGAMLAAWSAMASRTEAADAAALASQAKLSAAAEGALALAAWRLSANAEDPLMPSGRVETFSFEGVEVQVRVIAEIGLVDLNRAGPDALAAGFEAVGVEPRLAAQLAAEIGDWRDSDDTTRPGGAERGAYRSDQTGFIANRAFRTVEDLRAVRSMTPELFQAARAYFTVAGTSAPDPNFAPPALASLLSEAQARTSGEVSFPGAYTAYIAALGPQGGGYGEAVRFDRVAGDARVRILARRRLSLSQFESVFAQEVP